MLPLIPVLLFFVLWTGMWVPLAGRYFDFDAGARYSFVHFFAIYRTLAYVIFGTSAALSIFAVTCFPRTYMSPIFLAYAAVYALLFIAWLTFCYEHYQHVRYRTLEPEYTYSGVKYACTIALSLSSLLCFVIGLFGFIGNILSTR